MYQVSAGGVAFESCFPLNVGDKLALELQPPDWQKINAVAWVVRCKLVECEGKPTNLIGVEFLQSEEQEQEVLLQFLSQQSRYSMLQPAG